LVQGRVSGGFGIDGSVLVCDGVLWCLALFCSCSWKLLQVGLVVGGTRLVGFGFDKTATLLFRGGGGGERSSWSSLVCVVYVGCIFIFLLKGTIMERQYLSL
jgi:hypothetical protein